MKKVLERIKNLNILVFGDVMLDRYVNGEVNRISPEAPVPVIRVREEKSVPGGAANVALNLASLGASVETVGWFGKDEQGDQLVEILSKRKIEVDSRCRFSSAPTISKTRITSSNQQICRVDRESNAEAYSLGLDQFGSLLLEKAGNADAVIISDYGKGFVTNEALELLKGSARFLAVDPKPSRPVDYACPDLLTPNRFEALEMVSMSRKSQAPFPRDEVIEKIFEHFSPKMLAVTLGSEGMLLAEKGKFKSLIPTAAREVFDVSGAGDTIIATLTLGLVAGETFEDSAHLANLAAGIVVGKVGTATVTPEEILTVL